MEEIGNPSVSSWPLSTGDDIQETSSDSDFSWTSLCWTSLEFFFKVCFSFLRSLLQYTYSNILFVTNTVKSFTQSEVIRKECSIDNMFSTINQKFSNILPNTVRPEGTQQIDTSNIFEAFISVFKVGFDVLNYNGFLSNNKITPTHLLCIFLSPLLIYFITCFYSHYLSRNSSLIKKGKNRKMEHTSNVLIPDPKDCNTLILNPNLNQDHHASSIMTLSKRDGNPNHRNQSKLDNLNMNAQHIDQSYMCDTGLNDIKNDNVSLLAAAPESFKIGQEAQQQYRNLPVSNPLKSNQGPHLQANMDKSSYHHQKSYLEVDPLVFTQDHDDTSTISFNMDTNSDISLEKGEVDESIPFPTSTPSYTSSHHIDSFNIPTGFKLQNQNIQNENLSKCSSVDQRKNEDKSKKQNHRHHPDHNRNRGKVPSLPLSEISLTNEMNRNEMINTLHNVDKSKFSTEELGHHLKQQQKLHHQQSNYGSLKENYYPIRTNNNESSLSNITYDLNAKELRTEGNHEQNDNRNTDKQKNIGLASFATGEDQIRIKNDTQANRLLLDTLFYKAHIMRPDDIERYTNNLIANGCDSLACLKSISKESDLLKMCIDKPMHRILFYEAVHNMDMIIPNLDLPIDKFLSKFLTTVSAGNCSQLASIMKDIGIDDGHILKESATYCDDLILPKLDNQSTKLKISKEHITAIKGLLDFFKTCKETDRSRSESDFSNSSSH